jgi:nicotinamidase-related amidase
MKLGIIYVDLQVDFCEPSGSLFVFGSHTLAADIEAMLDFPDDELPQMVKLDANARLAAAVKTAREMMASVTTAAESLSDGAAEIKTRLRTLEQQLKQET